MWYYWYCKYGPGSQGFDDGFKWFSNNSAKEEIDDHMESFFRSRFDYVCQYSGWHWPVKNVPQYFLDKKVKDIENKINSLQWELRFYRKKKGIVVPEEGGIDETVTRNIKGRPKDKILKKLHKAGIIVDGDTLSSWAMYYPENHPEKCKKPIGPVREKILKIVRRIRTYSSYNK